MKRLYECRECKEYRLLDARRYTVAYPAIYCNVCGGIAKLVGNVKTMIQLELPFQCASNLVQLSCSYERTHN